MVTIQDTLQDLLDQLGYQEPEKAREKARTQKGIGFAGADPEALQKAYAGIGRAV